MLPRVEVWEIDRQFVVSRGRGCELKVYRTLAGACRAIQDIARPHNGYLRVLCFNFSSREDMKTLIDSRLGLAQ